VFRQSNIMLSQLAQSVCIPAGQHLSLLTCGKRHSYRYSAKEQDCIWPVARLPMIKCCHWRPCQSVTVQKEKTRLVLNTKTHFLGRQRNL